MNTLRTQGHLCELENIVIQEIISGWLMMTTLSDVKSRWGQKLQKS